MRRLSFCSSLLRPAAAATGVVVLALAAFLPAQASAGQPVSPAKKHVVINTYKGWDHSSSVGSFGCPNTTTYGQTFTAPSKTTNLANFSFYMNGMANSQSMVVRGEVYAWDGTKATGPAIFETAPRTISYSDRLYHQEVFKTPGATLTPGKQYVVFASIDKDFEQCLGSYVLSWGATNDSAYTDGTFVFQNNGGDESQWTSTAWSTVGIDAVFKICLS